MLTFRTAVVLRQFVRQVVRCNWFWSYTGCLWRTDTSVFMLWKHLSQSQSIHRLCEAKQSCGSIFIYVSRPYMGSKFLCFFNCSTRTTVQSPLLTMYILPTHSSVFDGRLFFSFINLQSHNLISFSRMRLVCNKTMYTILKLTGLMKCKFYNINECIAAAYFICKIYYFVWPSDLSFCTVNHRNDPCSRIAFSACVDSFVISIREELLHSILLPL